MRLFWEENFFFLTNQRKFVSQKAKERTLYANFIKTFLFPFRKGVSNPKSKGQRKLIVGKRIQKFQKKKKLKKQKKNQNESKTSNNKANETNLELYEYSALHSARIFKNDKKNNKIRTKKKVQNQEQSFGCKNSISEHKRILKFK